LNFTIKTGVGDFDISKWDEFNKKHPHGNVLQSHFMWKLFHQTTNFEPVVVSCFDNQSQLVGILLGVIIREADGLKGWFSSRMVVYGGPLIIEENPYRRKIMDLLLKQLILTTKNKAIFIQFRASFDLSEFDENFENQRFRWHPRINLLIDTSDEKLVISGMSASRLRQVKKSLKSGAVIAEASSMAHLEDFYKILRTLYNERVKKPLPSFSFFKEFYEATRNKNHGRIFLVMFEGKVIGGILCPFLDGGTLFEWYVCGLDQEFKQSGIYPSVVATWAAIDFALKNHLSMFDFMGLGKPDVKYGVRDFKLKFGGKVVNYGRYIRINRPIIYGIAELGYNLLAFFKKI